MSVGDQGEADSRRRVKKKGGRPKNYRVKVCFSLSEKAIDLLGEMDEERGGGAKGLIVEEALRLKHKMDKAFDEVAAHPLTGLLAQVYAGAQGEEAKGQPSLNQQLQQMKERLSK